MNIIAIRLEEEYRGLCEDFTQSALSAAKNRAEYEEQLTIMKERLNREVMLATEASGRVADMRSVEPDLKMKDSLIHSLEAEKQALQMKVQLLTQLSNSQAQTQPQSQGVANVTLANTITPLPPLTADTTGNANTVVDAGQKAGAAATAAEASRAGQSMAAIIAQNLSPGLNSLTSSPIPASSSSSPAQTPTSAPTSDLVPASLGPSPITPAPATLPSSSPASPAPPATATDSTSSRLDPTLPTKMEVSVDADAAAPVDENTENVKMEASPSASDSSSSASLATASSSLTHPGSITGSATASTLIPSVTPATPTPTPAADIPTTVTMIHKYAEKMNFLQNEVRMNKEKRESDIELLKEKTRHIESLNLELDEQRRKLNEGRTNLRRKEDEMRDRDMKINLAKESLTKLSKENQHLQQLHDNDIQRHTALLQMLAVSDQRAKQAELSLQGVMNELAILRSGSKTVHSKYLLLIKEYRYLRAENLEIKAQHNAYTKEGEEREKAHAQLIKLSNKQHAQAETQSAEILRLRELLAEKDLQVAELEQKMVLMGEHQVQAQAQAHVLAQVAEANDSASVDADADANSNAMPVEKEKEKESADAEMSDKVVDEAAEAGGESNSNSNSSKDEENGEKKNGEEMADENAAVIAKIMMEDAEEEKVPVRKLTRRTAKKTAAKRTKKKGSRRSL